MAQLFRPRSNTIARASIAGAGLFVARPTVVVQFDSEARETQFQNRCPACGDYQYVTGATPVFLKPGSAVPENGFARTDLDFGSDDAKAPLVLCGDEAVRRLKRRRLRGLTFVKEVGKVPGR